jgi:hypothetical protein
MKVKCACNLQKYALKFLQHHKKGPKNGQNMANSFKKGQMVTLCQTNLGSMQNKIFKFVNFIALSQVFS